MPAKKKPKDTFPENLRRVRREAGLSQHELAVRAGLSAGAYTGTVGRLERGAGNPTLSTLRKLAEALGVPLAALVGPALGVDPALPRRPPAAARSRASGSARRSGSRRRPARRALRFRGRPTAPRATRGRRRGRREDRGRIERAWTFSRRRGQRPNDSSFPCVGPSIPVDRRARGGRDGPRSPSDVPDRRKRSGRD